ncbi:D-sedoheptulose-7-phosphate isomerase [Actinomadura livida]|uniref:D-sedoheptulose 7-phosphate isomerase n=1 Tax=Actinomadura livida TaxID=79909 RepID=A0A7W7IIM5_9ACTN|nr:MULTISPECIES: SIS domain-containing protein [Actinomadura]MBB4777782.1 D-sedoheptulose 7-phosphate isomerase [Actinomadura catellatispora]GGT98759.1 phosphoheptose isomerase [Actinomadura livida]
MTVTEVFRRRAEPAAALAGEAGTIAAACHAMAARFHRGGRLFTFGTGGAATDAQHVAVEFVHPVIVGKRALPALSLTGDVATLTGVGAGAGFDEIFAHQLRCFGGPDDMALGISPDGRCGSVRRALATARDLGMLTVALAGGDGGELAGAADHLVTVPSADPRVVKEVHVTAYHVLWELVHVFLEQPDVLTGEDGA